MKKILFIFFLTSKLIFAQSEKPIREWYSMSATELIFSSGDVKSDSLDLRPVVRFTVFLHIQVQGHYNFSNHFGLYTGLGTRNIGLINKFDYYGDEVTIKQRSYSLGVPLAFKVGNMKKNKFFALGGEAEWMFAYKRKILYKDEKNKNSEWFSGQVNPLNVSVFAELHFSRHGYLKGKYYLIDFLADKDMSFYLPDSGAHIYYKPTSSKMFYISIGTTFLNLKKKHATKDKV